MNLPRLSLQIIRGAALLGLAASLAAAQSVPAAPPAGADLRIFLQGPGLEDAALPGALPFVRLVGEPGQAQVLVSGDAGPDGLRIVFRGQGEFAGDNAMLVCRPEPGEPPEAFRGRTAQMVKLGLLRYAAKTPASSRISLRLMDTVRPTSVVDPWDFWVFNAQVNTFLTGEQSYRTEMWMGNLSASRVTPQWKMRFGLNGNYQVSAYSLEDFNYRSTSNSRSFNGLIVRSLGEHWSAGARLEAGSSTFDNSRWRLLIRPAVEYDLFPYAESTQRQLRFLYSVGPTFVRYREETIYDRFRETLLSQSLTAALEIKKSWGAVSASLEGSHYLGQPDKYRLELNADLSVRLFQGFNFNVRGGGSRIHDQLSLPKGGATYEEVILQRRQLATGFQYFFSAGFSISFGSLNSNVINPRFGSGNGGMSIHMSM